ncbi:MAG: glycosyltransferase [Agathobaculum sp.]|uniref:glycosyltransferase family 2 protein n=1 Tax=Agathobaculum sp. TaxID=2048138 RepID=UPI0025C25999|nr:glycosyltransferase [Agathobaculum sp.]MDY3711833.1 glycosyltransferase [Agathobaculum sp.]
MLFSIIVPVYNVEHCLGKCVDSLLPLLGEDCELVFVIGASTDRSNEIVYNYAHQNQAASVVLQGGTGLSNARNCGVQSSSGAFLLYIDSDDMVDTASLAMLMEHIRSEPAQADVYMSDYVQLFPSGERRAVCQVDDTPMDAGLSALPAVLREKKCFWNVWRYVYRRSFLEKNHICFLENRTSEDIDYTTRVFIERPRIVFWHKPYYIYRMGRANSLMNVVSLKRVQDVTAVIESSIALLDKHEGFPYAALLQEQFRFEYLLNIALIGEVGQQERSAALDAFRRWKAVLQPARYIITKVFYRLMCIFGLPIGASVLLLAKRVKRKVIRR